MLLLVLFQRDLIPSFREDLRAFWQAVWHCVNLTDGRRLRPKLLFGSTRPLKVELTGRSSHFQTYVETRLSRFSMTHVFDKSATVKCHAAFDRTYLL